jgi:hypothetical protein
VNIEKWTLTTVYGPQTEAKKLTFMVEIRLLKQIAHERWLLLGDFNLIYRANDKSNANINRRLMNRFWSCLDEIEMKEIQLHGRRYTWTSSTQNPTQTKIDHIFATKDWEFLYLDYHLQAGGTSVSDHCPLILAYNPLQKRFKGICFESCWLLYPEFKEMVTDSSSMPVSTSNKARALHIKLARLAKTLKRWHKQRVAENRRESNQAQQLVLRIDQLQDERQLTDSEFQLKKEAKNRILALAAVKRIRLCQRSHLKWIRVGDTNTKLFPLRANARQRRNHIPSLQHKGMTCITQEAKVAALADFFHQTVWYYHQERTHLELGTIAVHAA